jgi:predicted ATPase
MIKRLHVQNFLSLRDVDLELTQRNVLVGPNMSGKSNLIDCLAFLTQVAVSGLKQALLDRSGFAEVAWKGSPSDHRIGISLSYEQRVPQEPPTNYEYKISILGSQAGFVSIEKETIVIEKEGQRFTLVELVDGRGSINHLDGRQISTTTGAPNASALEMSVPGWKGMEVKNFIASWRFYNLIPKLMKSVNAAAEQKFLTQAGDNFSSWMMTLNTKYREEFNRLKQVASDALPGLMEILSPPTQFATTFLLTKERHLSTPVNIWRMADGELAFLGLLSLILAPAQLSAPLFCIEEPESHLHPRLMDTLVEVWSQVQLEWGADSSQVIITTHSPQVVDRMKLEDLIVLERAEGETRCTRPSSKSHLREMLEKEEAGLGDLWYSGALGGV